MKFLHMLAFTLVLVGAINWGLIAVADLNLVTRIFGESSMFVQYTYMLVGAAGVYLAFTHKGDCETCSNMMKKKK